MKMTLEDFLKGINYKITEGERYLWSCYGNNAWYWDSWGDDGKDLHNGFSVVFDTESKEVFEVTCYSSNDVYVYHNPKFTDLYKKECLDRKVPIYASEVTYSQFCRLMYPTSDEIDELQD